MKTLSERLTFARKSAMYASARQFALKHSIPENVYRSHERDEKDPAARKPKDPTVKKYARLLGVNYVWLLTGHGEMTDTKYEQRQGKAGALNDGPSTDPKKSSVAWEVANFLQAYEDLSPAAKHSVQLAIVEDYNDEAAKKNEAVTSGVPERDRPAADNVRKK